MQSGLSEEQDMIASTVRRFGENEIDPHEELVGRTVDVLYASEDRKQGARAFAGRRRPVWKGR